MAVITSETGAQPDNQQHCMQRHSSLLMEGSQDVASCAASHTLWEAARLGCCVQVLDSGDE